MFAVYFCCQPSRLLLPFPPGITEFRVEWTAWTALKTTLHTDRRQLTPEHLSLLCELILSKRDEIGIGSAPEFMTCRLFPVLGENSSRV
jgi:hypothetical protein